MHGVGGKWILDLIVHTRVYILHKHNEEKGTYGLRFDSSEWKWRTEESKLLCF